MQAYDELRLEERIIKSGKMLPYVNKDISKLSKIDEMIGCKMSVNLTVPPIKGLERAMTKLDEYIKESQQKFGDFVVSSVMNVKDLTRCSFVCNSA